MTPAAYRELIRIAARYSRRAVEAEDLVQDALLAAVEAGRDPAALVNRRWLVGVVRNRAAFVARGMARRRRREALWHEERIEALRAQPVPAGSFSTALEKLPSALKAVAALAFTGHSRREIAYLLAIPDTALRQRLSTLKRRLARLGVYWPEATPGLVLPLDYGRIRGALQPRLSREGGLFASHDPDGHLFVVRRSQTGATRQPGSDGSSNRSPP